VCKTRRSVLLVKVITNMLQPHLSPVVAALPIRGDYVPTEGTPEPASCVVTKVHMLAKVGRDLDRRHAVADDKMALQFLLRREVGEASSCV
jgi:hypothetical protein